MKLNYGDIAAQKVSERIAEPVASASALAAVPADRRVNGMICMTLDKGQVYRFVSTSSASASSTVVVPSAGTGRWHKLVDGGAVVVLEKSIGFADITDPTAAKTIDFDDVFPAGATYMGAAADVTAIFDNAGDSASVTFDLGIKSGDTDAFIDAGSLNAVAKVNTPQGVTLGGTALATFTPSIIFNGSVNLNTLTKGAARFTLAYLLPTG